MMRHELSASDRFLCAFYRSGAGLGFCFGMPCLLSAASTAPFTEVEQVWASASVHLVCFRSLPLHLLPKWSRFGLLLRYILPAFSRFHCTFYRSGAGLGFCFGNSSAAGIHFSSSEKQCLTLHYQNGMIKLTIYKNYLRRPHGKNPHPLPAHRTQHKQALPQRTLGPVHDGHHQVRTHPAGRQNRRRREIRSQSASPAAKTAC